MRKSFTAILLAALVVPMAATAQADDLFSGVSIGSPFGADEAQQAKPPAAAPQRLAGPASLAEMLRKAGLAPRKIDTRTVSVKIQGSNTLLPVRITFSEGNQRMRMVMILGLYQAGQSLPNDQLLGLLDANRENPKNVFAYSQKQRRTELHRLVENRSMTPDRLKAELAGMARTAEQSQQLWVSKSTAPAATPAAKPQTVAATPKPTPKPTPAVNTPAAKPTVTPPRTNPALVGRWGASRSKTEAFALQINTNGTFALVTVIGGRTSQSTGKFTLAGNKLTLKDAQGTQIVGTVTLRSGKQFNFLPAGATAPLTFKKPS